MFCKFLLAIVLVASLAAGPALAQQQDGEAAPVPPGIVPDAPITDPLLAPSIDPNLQPMTQTPLATEPAPQGTPQRQPPLELVPADKQALELSARFSDGGEQIRSGVAWRVFRVATDEKGEMPLVAESFEPTPRFVLDRDVYIIHAGYGLAAATLRVELTDTPIRADLVLNAGGLKTAAAVEGQPVPDEELTSRIQLILPSGDRRLIAEDVPGTEIARLPEGRYFVESVYGGLNAVVSGEIEIKAGQLSSATFRHRAATLTMKLVSQPGGEALANTSWSILTPGGDVIRESIGAFPSMILAEGQYTVVARHEGRVYQREFEVQTGRNQEVEVLAEGVQ